MNKFILAILILFTGQISFSQVRNIDVLHYRFSISLNEKNDTIIGSAQIVCLATEDLSELRFDLAGPKKDKGMVVLFVMFGNGLKDIPKYSDLPKYYQTNDELVITANKTYKKGDTILVNISYGGIPDDGLIISKNKYGDKTFFADNWPNRAHHWLPCIDRPDDKASFEFIVMAPPQYQVVSNGIKTEEMIVPIKTDRDEMSMPMKTNRYTHWKENTPLPTKVMVIGVAKFAVKTFTDSPDGIPVSAWVYQQDSLPGFRNYSVAPSILKFMIDYIGPYPYKKLANVQSKTIFGGMENASAIFYEETSAALFQNIETLLAHEIAHQWFGDMASEKSFPHLWLSEGFATYLTHIYIESKYGTDSLNKEMKTDRDAIIGFIKESNRPVVDSVSPLMSLLNANSYQKGGWILHMLRRQLGDSIFHSIIRKYYVAYAGKNADTRDFEKICEEESGKDLHYFFDQWLYSPGVPRVEIKWTYDKTTRSLILKTKQLQAKAFQFPLEMQLQSIHLKPRIETINIARQEQEFKISTNDQPGAIVPDPNISVLCICTVQKGK